MKESKDDLVYAFYRRLDFKECNQRKMFSFRMKPIVFLLLKRKLDERDRPDMPD